MKMNVKKQLIRQHVRDTTGLSVLMKDIHNIASSVGHDNGGNDVKEECCSEFLGLGKLKLLLYYLIKTKWVGSLLMIIATFLIIP